MFIEAPFPGMVTSLPITLGTIVNSEDVVCVIEMMKMEIPIHAGMDGTLVGIMVKVGDLLDAGTVIAELTDN